jgi:hypothetical protein
MGEIALLEQVLARPHVMLTFLSQPGITIPEVLVRYIGVNLFVMAILVVVFREVIGVSDQRGSVHRLPFPRGMIGRYLCSYNFICPLLYALQWRVRNFYFLC